MTTLMYVQWIGIAVTLVALVLLERARRGYLRAEEGFNRAEATYMRIVEQRGKWEGPS